MPGHRRRSSTAAANSPPSSKAARIEAVSASLRLNMHDRACASPRTRASTDVASRRYYHVAPDHRPKCAGNQPAITGSCLHHWCNGVSLLFGPLSPRQCGADGMTRQGSCPDQAEFQARRRPWRTEAAGRSRPAAPAVAAFTAGSPRAAVSDRANPRPPTSGSMTVC